MIEDLSQGREAIDKIDQELIRLLAERYKVVAEIGVFKTEHNLLPLDPARWQTVLATRIAWGEQLGLTKGQVEEFWELIHKHALRIEEYGK